MNFEEAVTEYFEEKKGYIKPSSYERYTLLVPRIKTFFGGKDIKEINSKDLQLFINWLNDEQFLSVSSIKLHIMFLKSVIFHFNDDKRFNKLNYPKTEKSSIKIYTDEEAEKIIKYIFEKNEKGKFVHLHSCLGELIAFYTGMRLGEILALQWQDINFDADFIDVNKNAYTNSRGNTVITSPKTLASYRKIPLHPKLKKALSLFKSECGTDYVIGTQQGKKVKFPRTLQRHNEDMCRKIGIKSKGMHAYRHYFATYLIKKTNRVKLVSECLGHSSVIITQNVYNNPSLEDKNELIKCLD